MPALTEEFPGQIVNIVDIFRVITHPATDIFDGCRLSSLEAVQL